MKIRTVSFPCLLAIGACGAAVACHQASSARSDRNLATPLTTGFENQLSAPLGQGGELVAYTATAWDSGWRALNLPGPPPAVDFSQNVATLRAEYFGGSPSEYESGVDSAVSDANGILVTVYAHVRISGVGVDTSSRKVLATAIRVPSNRPRVLVHWRLTAR